MTNYQIKKIFKLSLIFIPLLTYLFMLINQLIFFWDSDMFSYQISQIFKESFIIVPFSLPLPFIVVAIIRVYNLLIHGKFIVEESK